MNRPTMTWVNMPGSADAKTVIIVDDEVNIVNLLVDILNSAGYRPIGCSVWTEAMDAINRESPDLVLLDLKMPTIDGPSMLDFIRKEGLDVRMTRDGDRYLSLEERTEIANRLGADLFVSIHANAARNRRSHGVETYLLDTRYDKQTARVAARENGTTVADLKDLHKILASLRLGYNERFAARLAFQLHRSLVGELRRSYRGTQDLGVKRGPFLVLFAARMPAVLVEIGFLSNGAEAKRLRSKTFTKAAAGGIASGILAYRNEHARWLLAER